MECKNKRYSRWLTWVLLFGMLLTLCAAPRSVSLAAGGDTEPGDITGQCSIKASNGRITLKSLTDSSIWTTTPFGARDWLSLQWRSPLLPQGLYLLWDKTPGSYYIEQRDLDGEMITVTEFTGELPQAYLPLPENCGMILLYARDNGSLKRLCVCAANTPLPAWVHDWLPPAQEADLMLAVAYPGDEFTVFPGILETYILERQLSLSLIYMAAASEQQMTEALDALWNAGLRQQPTVGPLETPPAQRVSSGQENPFDEDRAAAFLVEQIRRFRPRVLVSHAAGGEDADSLRCGVGSIARRAVLAAFSADSFADSADRFGLWQLSKLYLQDFNQQQLRIGGKVYGLANTTVGQDSGINDLFENIPPEEYVGYVLPAVAPAPASAAAPAEPSPTPAPTSTPVPAPTAEMTEAEEEDEAAPRLEQLVRAGLCVLALIILTLAAALIARGIEKRRLNRAASHTEEAAPEEGQEKTVPEEGSEDAPETEDMANAAVQLETEDAEKEPESVNDEPKDGGKTEAFEAPDAGEPHTEE